MTETGGSFGTTPGTPSVSGTDRGTFQEQTSQATERARQSAEQVTEQARRGAQQAQGRLRQEFNDRSTQSGSQLHSTADDLRAVAKELRNQGKETPARLAEQGADRLDRVGSYLTDADADRVLSDLENFGRRRPWAVVAGGLLVGFAASRFLKASSAERYRFRHGSTDVGRDAASLPPLTESPGYEPAGGTYGATGAVGDEPVVERGGPEAVTIESVGPEPIAPEPGTPAQGVDPTPTQPGAPLSDPDPMRDRNG